MRKIKKPAIYTQSHRNADLLRSWRDNLIRESNGVPLLLIVGGKVLQADALLTNIAHAIQSQEPDTLVANGYSPETP
jgi:hypothetical protein